jgi:hypothetical protein
MGKLSSLKGKSYERRIANVLRRKWPGIEVRRSSQSDKPYNSDVYVAIGSGVLTQCWFECQDSRKPTPEVKLEQAERDIAGVYNVDWALQEVIPRLPVVVWHRIGERTSYATTRLWVLDAVRGVTSPVRSEAVTMPLEQFLDVLSGGVR